MEASLLEVDSRAVSWEVAGVVDCPADDCDEDSDSDDPDSEEPELVDDGDCEDFADSPELSASVLCVDSPLDVSRVAAVGAWAGALSELEEPDEVLVGLSLRSDAALELLVVACAAV